MINETYSAFVQGFMPTLARPDVDVLEGLTTAIIVDQERMGANVRSTVGTATDAERDAAHPVQPARQAAHRSAAARTRSTSPLPTASGGDHGRARARASGPSSATLHPLRRHVPALRGHGLGHRLRPDRALRRQQVAQRGRAHDPRLQHGRAGTAASSRGCGYFDPDKPISEFTKNELHDLLYKEPTKIKVEGINLTYEGLIPKIQKSMLSKDVDALQPHIRAFVERAVDVHHLPRLRRHPAQRGGPVVEDRGRQHRRRLRDADQRPRRVDARPRRAVGRAAARRRCGRPSTRSSRSGSATSRSTGRRARCRAARRSAPR